MIKLNTIVLPQFVMIVQCAMCNVQCTQYYQSPLLGDTLLLLHVFDELYIESAILPIYRYL